MIDGFGRDIHYLRISVTDKCNLRCRYCMPAVGVCKRSHHEMLTEEETILAVCAAASLGIRKIRIAGGTGFSPRDITPEVTIAVAQRLVPGIPEAMRAESMRITPKGCLSRSAAGIRGRTLIINLPGSPKAAKENILAVIDPVEHGLEMLCGEGSADCAR